MTCIRRAVNLPLAAVVCVLVVAIAAATPRVAAAESLPAAAPQDSSAPVEVSLALDRSTRRLLQQGLRNEGFDPGTPDGLFGPRTRAAIWEWQRSQGASPTGYLNGAEAELLRTAAAPAAASEAPPPAPAVPAVDPNASSAATASASMPAETDSSPTSPAAVAAEELAAAEPNTQQRPGADGGNGTVQLPLEILIDRYLLRAERLFAADDPAGALEAMHQILALQDDQDEHDLVLQDDFNFLYAQVAYAAGRTETAVAALNEYLVAAGSTPGSTSRGSAAQRPLHIDCRPRRSGPARQPGLNRVAPTTVPGAVALVRSVPTPPMPQVSRTWRRTSLSGPATAPPAATVAAVFTVAALGLPLPKTSNLARATPTVQPIAEIFSAFVWRASSIQNLGCLLGRWVSCGAWA